MTTKDNGAAAFPVQYAAGAFQVTPITSLHQEQSELTK